MMSDNSLPSRSPSRPGTGESQIGDKILSDGYRTAFANLHLRVERENEEWTVRVLDLNERETLYEINSSSVLAAKTEAVDFALARLFGARHGKDAKRMAETLAWTEAHVKC